MSNICQICGKQGTSGNRVSHSNRKTRRRWKVNLQRVAVEFKGTRQRMLICTRCLRSGKVRKVLPSTPGVTAVQQAETGNQDTV